MPNGRVLIAWDDGPLAPSPTWTCLDDGVTFPLNFVSGYDVNEGKQTLLEQTNTGTATVYINDRAGLFDDRNTSSPYQGKLSGRQILLQLRNPVTSTWQSQFRGLLNTYTYDIDGSAVGADGNPINATIQLDCVDIFDYLAGYGLTAGLDGVIPPAGSEDGIWYAETTGTVDDRIIEILTDVGIDSTRYVVFSGNVAVQAVKYDPDQAALVALRDAADAEFPFIANIYVDRFGRFCFHGRYARFDPDGVSADAGTARWDFHRWQVGDGKNIILTPARAQMRVLDYTRDRADLINVAVCYPANMPTAQMPNQVYANAPSITSYGKHAAPPMSDLLTATPIFDAAHGGPADRYAETLAYAQFLVLAKKDPIVAITSLQLRSIQPYDARAASTWQMLTQADISDIVNVAAGYPGGTGFTGSSPADDHFIEGRKLTVRPANTGYDDVTLELDLSPARWSQDVNSVFPARA